MAKAWATRRKDWNEGLSVCGAITKCTPKVPCVVMTAALATETTFWKNLLNGEIAFQPFSGATAFFLSCCPFCGAKVAK